MELIFKIFLWLGLGLGLSSYIQCQSLRGANLILSTGLDTPYIRFRDVNLPNITGNDRFEGFIVDLIEEASKILEFNYVLKFNENGYAGKDQHGKWQGTIGDIVNGRAHIAAGPIDITQEREAVVDFTHPFMNAGIGIIFKKSGTVTLGFFDSCSLLQPFKNYITDAFLLIVIILGVALLLLRRKHKSSWFRTLLGLWLVFVFVFASLFIAQLSAFYVVMHYVDETSHNMFAKVDEIASQSRVKYGLIQGGSTQEFFRNSNISTYAKMWSIMQSSDPSPFVRDNIEGIERVKKGSYAFLTESPFIEYAVQRDCDLYQVGSLLSSKGYGLAVQQGSSIREALNMAILELQERGTIAALKNKWWTERNGGGSCTLKG